MRPELTIALLLWVAAAASDQQIVAHYRRALRLRERRQRRDTGIPYWSSPNAHPHDRQRFWPEQTTHLDLYIYAPAKHTIKQAGESVYFDCELTGGYSATWSRENGERFSPFTETKKLANRNIYRIDIENLDSSDSGKYICAANTGNPEDRESVFLEVRGQRELQPKVDTDHQRQHGRYPHVDDMLRREHEMAMEQQRMELYRQRMEEERERERQQKLGEQYREKEAQVDQQKQVGEWPGLEEAKRRQEMEEAQRREEERRRLQEQYQTEARDLDQLSEVSAYTDREIYLTDEGNANLEGTEAAEDQPFPQAAEEQRNEEQEHPYFQRKEQTIADQAKQETFVTDAAEGQEAGKTEGAFTVSNGEVYSDYVYDYMMDE